jgi:copper oxidase (laccase) domain-containing protein
MYQLPRLASVPGLSYGCSTRGGNGEGNQRPGMRPEESVTQNRAVFLEKICPHAPRGFFNMTVEMNANSLVAGHKDEIRVVRSKWDGGKGMLGTPGIACEAMVTDAPNLILYLTVGDCIPIVIFDPHKRVLALVHAGRESTIRRIPEKTLQVMRKKFGVDPADVLVGMGPGFRSHSLERLPAGISDDPLWDIHISPNGHGTFLMDLFGYNEDRLVAAGVPEEQIEACPFDTYKEADMFFSHRREIKTKEPEGRHACAVGMLP